MSTTKVSALAEKTNTGGGEELLINDSGTSKKVSINNVLPDNSVKEKHLDLISTSSVPSLEAKGDGSSQDGYIQLNCSQNSHGIKLKSPPHSANASYTLTFPNNDGDANQKLTTNGSGVLTWTADTDTTYSIQDGELSQNNFTNDDHTKLNGIAASANNYVHPNHSGEVTSTADGATVIVDNIVDEANLKVNSPTNGYVLTAQSGQSGGLLWAEIQSGNTTANGLWEHAHTIASNYSITSGNNAIAAGPITINSGVSVTVPTGSTWVVA